ncbi:hypothetical protein D3C77_602010 [compost metagenome]
MLDWISRIYAHHAGSELEVVRLPIIDLRKKRLILYIFRQRCLAPTKERQNHRCCGGEHHNRKAKLDEPVVLGEPEPNGNCENQNRGKCCDVGQVIRP